MNNELYHYGVLGMKWGVRRYQNSDGSLTTKGAKRYSEKQPKQTTSKLVNSYVRKRAAKAEKRNTSIERMTDTWGVTGVALRSGSNYAAKKRLKGTLAKAINGAANVYISKNSSNYHVAKGVDYARRAAINGLSISVHADQIRALSDVAKSAMYASAKGKAKR